MVADPTPDGGSQIWNFGMVKLKFTALESMQLVVQIALLSPVMSGCVMRPNAMDITGGVRQPKLWYHSRHFDLPGLWWSRG